jgi:SNF2-related domain/Helicase conserved C-terminal domain
MILSPFNPYQAQYLAWLLTRQAAGGSFDAMASTLLDSQVDVNPHQIDAALFACNNPLSRGVILADEVGLGKTIEAGLVIAQRWAERRRAILIIVPANLRKQWHQELQDKFNLHALILEAKNYAVRSKQNFGNPFLTGTHELNPFQPIICSYQFAKTKAHDLQNIAWDLVVMDEAHRLRNVYKPTNVIGRALRSALSHAPSKVLLTATPLQNSLLELYGLVSMVDDRVFGDLDSFRTQFSQSNKAQTFETLRNRLEPICKRTLRRQVQQYVPYTARRAIVEEFTPSNEEKELASLVSEYLRRPNLKALPQGQRQLISLVLWKLLASSTHAIAGALETMANRLQNLLALKSPQLDLTTQFEEDYEALNETADEWSASGDNANAQLKSTELELSQQEKNAIADEIAELKRFKTLATSVSNDAKGAALLTALDRAFKEMDRLGAAQKAIIFTESRKTQDYLVRILENTPYSANQGLVLFNGTNTDAGAQTIYRQWLKRHANTDKISGSKSADTRAALVEHFQRQGKIMIATEAGAEGINLQFCSLVINYDLPWNPQRIEQRIGRCHRYGQKHDVVVVNFVDRSNLADARVYELLAEKFQLFEGVFGVSDEVLGAIGAGVDFERRIADIYQNCRTPETIKTSFDQLQLDLKGEISDAMVKTRAVLLENFDQVVQDNLRIRQQDSSAAINRQERLLLTLTKDALGAHAQFDESGFLLSSLPITAPQSIALGRYELPRHSGQAHLYRQSHPLAQWILEQAKQHIHTAQARPHLSFDYERHGTPVSTLKTYRSQTGQLCAQVLTVNALKQIEEHVIVSAVTSTGTIMLEDDPDKLLQLPCARPSIELSATCAGTADAIQMNIDAIEQLLVQDLTQRRKQLLGNINTRNLGHFEKEVEKLDAWADDLKLGLEQQIKEIDRQIKEVRRSAATAATLEDKLQWHKHQRELESKRSQLRRELFARQDDIEAQRNGLITALESQLKQQVQIQTLFTVSWELV